jgi:regulator of cell morphogenesis and NO signaling
METTNQTLADLARATPAATRVFLRHRLDFCCGGHRTLAEACGRAGLDPTSVVSEIEAEKACPDDLVRWEERPASELADHIEQRYHAALRRDVPALVAAARRVERVHAAKPDVPAGLADHLADFWADLEQHMRKEEQVLFPMLRQGARGEMVYVPVRAMEAEHDAHGQALARVRALTFDLAIPAHACATWSALYRGLEALEAELMQHVHLENHILFARAVQGEPSAPVGRVA